MISVRGGANLRRMSSRAPFAAAAVGLMIGSGGPLMAAPTEFRLAALSAPSGSETSASVPASQFNFALGSSIYLEVWVQTTDPNGLSSASLDLTFDPALAGGIAITPTALFSSLTHGIIDNGAGLIDDLSGSHLGPCTDAVAVAPNWARLAIVEFAANAEGVLHLNGAPTGSVIYGTAVCGVGDIDPGSVAYGSVTVSLGDAGIPAASTWGVLTMTLLLVIAGTLLMTRRWPVRAAADQALGSVYRSGFDR